MLKHIGNYFVKRTEVPTLQQFVRYKRSGFVKKLDRKKRTLNPGVNLQANSLNDSKDTEFDAEEIDELESDFMRLDLSHKEHLEEIDRLKEKEKLQIVKQKYFKEKLPNFLTWNDKKQIQYLHKTDPEEWTLEKLSDGFPALPETIKAIVKATWTKHSPLKIINHDNSVKKNWILFKTGKLDLPSNLINHLNKFTGRDIVNEKQTLPVINEKIVKWETPQVAGEFSEIIQSYERIKNRNKSTNEKGKDEREHQTAVIKSRKIKKEMYLTENTNDQSKMVTLEHLKASLEKNVSLGNNIDLDDKILLKQLSDVKVANERKTIAHTETQNPIVDISNISKTGYLSPSKSTLKDDSHLRYPEKIIIPKDKLKRGYTYKLNDCYYDSDGLFLYRVPGMVK